jgi:hypothetical protein
MAVLRIRDELIRLRAYKWRVPSRNADRSVTSMVVGCEEPSMR